MNLLTSMKAKSKAVSERERDVSSAVGDGERAVADHRCDRGVGGGRKNLTPRPVLHLMISDSHIGASSRKSGECAPARLQRRRIQCGGGTGGEIHSFDCQLHPHFVRSPRHTSFLHDSRNSVPCGMRWMVVLEARCRRPDLCER